MILQIFLSKNQRCQFKFL